MVKMVAVHVVYDAISAGRVTFDTMLPIRPETSVFSRDRTWSNVPLEEDSTYSVRELLEVVIVRSACAATVALGEGIFGSERAFVERMNAKARSLNIRASFHDSWGGSPENRVSPLALAWLVRALLMDYPEVLEISSMPEVTFKEVDLLNSNHLLTRYPDADGLKTGFTNPAGHCLIGTAQRDGRRLITVTMGNTVATRYPDTEALLDFGFANAERIIRGLRPVNIANPSNANLILDGESMPLTAFLINGSHYFKLRDIAYLLNETAKQFEVLWDAASRTASLLTGLPYTAVGGELSVASGARPFTLTSTRILFDGEERSFEVYMIDGNNYFRLRDLGTFLGFAVDWIGETRTVIINTAPITEAA
jgi:hypothetical protein